MDDAQQPRGLGRGIGYGLAAAALGAAVWAVLTAVTDYKLGLIAVGIGFLVGFAMQRSGSTDSRLPIAGAVIALLGCFVGDVLIDAHALASFLRKDGDNTSTFEVLRQMLEDPNLFWAVYKAGFAGLDVLFYGIAAYEGFKFAAIGVQRTRHELTPPPPFPTSDAATGAETGTATALPGDADPSTALPGGAPGKWGASRAKVDEPDDGLNPRA